MPRTSPELEVELAYCWAPANKKKKNRTSCTECGWDLDWSMLRRLEKPVCASKQCAEVAAAGVICLNLSVVLREAGTIQIVTIITPVSIFAQCLSKTVRLQFASGQ